MKYRWNHITRIFSDPTVCYVKEVPEYTKDYVAIVTKPGRFALSEVAVVNFVLPKGWEVMIRRLSPMGFGYTGILHQVITEALLRIRRCADIFELCSINIPEEEQGKGHGTNLMKLILGAQKNRVWVLKTGDFDSKEKRARLRKFYESVGFEKIDLIYNVPSNRDSYLYTGDSLGQRVKQSLKEIYAVMPRIVHNKYLDNYLHMGIDDPEVSAALAAIVHRKPLGSMNLMERDKASATRILTAYFNKVLSRKELDLGFALVPIPEEVRSWYKKLLKDEDMLELANYHSHQLLIGRAEIAAARFLSGNLS